MECFEQKLKKARSTRSTHRRTNVLGRGSKMWRPQAGRCGVQDPPGGRVAEVDREAQGRP